MYKMAGDQIDEITRYIFLEDPLEKADMIFIPGCPRPEHTEEAARLYLAGYAPILLPSGGYTKLEGGFRGVKKGGERYGRDFSCEADFLEAVLLAHGVPGEAILKEREATYTLENAEKSRRLLEALGEIADKTSEKTSDGIADETTEETRHEIVDETSNGIIDETLGLKGKFPGGIGIPEQAIICCKAHHARRCYMYYSMVFPETRLIMHPVIVDGIGPDTWFKSPEGRRTVLGELSRVGDQLLMMEGRLSWDRS